MSSTQPTNTHAHADKDGHFRRVDSKFRNFISREPDSQFPAEAGRYALYVNYGCPWAHRTILVRALKGLTDIIQLIVTDFDLTANGWIFTGQNGSDERDPLYGFTALKQLYLKADPEYTGRFTVPCLWDKKTETVVNNESSEIIRMLYSEFDDLILPSLREASKNGGEGGFLPPRLRSEIDEMNDWVYNTINNGVYKVGFATTQQAYDANIYPLFESLDRMEAHLSAPAHQPFIFGQRMTEADIRLFTTVIRFDAAYHTIFQCNLKSIRQDYPNIYLWLRRLYWDDTELTGGVFKSSTNFLAYRWGYTRAKARMAKGQDEGQSEDIVMPRGPLIDIHTLKDGELSLATAVTRAS